MIFFMKNRIGQILHELKAHAPFAALATLIAVFITIFIQYFLRKQISEDVFHFSHFLHIIASAMVTAGIFYKYKSQFILALLIGLIGAIIMGSLSDVIFPYLGGVLLNLNIHFHLPLIEEPGFTLFSALIGSLAGILTRITKYPHFIHVFLSIFASLFYLLAFTLFFSLSYFIGAFFIVFFAVIIPCCLSDIVFPFFFLPISKKPTV